jgi:hypothetical protein
MQRELRRSASILAFFVLILAAALPLSAQNNPKNLNPIPSPRGSNPAWGGGMPWTPGAVHRELYQLWKKLPGSYEEGEGESRRSLELTAVEPYAISVETRDAAGAVLRGWLVLGDASTSYRSPKMRFALQFRPDVDRNEYACTFYGVPTADGITFESEGTDCSFTLGQKVSKLKIEISAGRIAISDPKDGEATFVRRAAKS